MNPDLSLSPSLAPDAGQTANSPEWNEHEHVAEQVQLQAQKLVDLTGSPELAKYAIGVVEQSQSDSPGEGSSPASPPTSKGNDQYLKALENFERSLETPVMSGELIGWVTTVHRACEAVGALLHDDVKNKHAALYANIARQDTELASRVEKLRANDEQLDLVGFCNVQSSLQQLLERAEPAEQDESKVSLLRADVVKQALAFVISARTQETAIATWFSEAFNRDSGAGD